MRIARESLSGSSSYEATLRPDGILEILIRGTWTVAEVDAFFVALGPLHDAGRRQFGAVRMLTIVEAVQPPLVALRVRHHSVTIKQARDRRAFVLFTALAKLQIKRLRTSEVLGLFTDRAAAEAWLLA